MRVIEVIIWTQPPIYSRVHNTANEGEVTHVPNQNAGFETEFGKLRQKKFSLDMCLTSRSLLSRLVRPFLG